MFYLLGGVNVEMEEKIEPKIKDLIGLLSSSDDLARTGACKSLITIGSPAVPFLVKALEDPDYLVRWEAAKALSAIGDSTSAEALAQALEDEEFEVRWRAAEGLIKMGASGLRPLLHALIKDGDSVSLREVAHHILHNVEGTELRNCLRPVLIALEGRWPSVEVPAAALRAAESLEKFQEAHRETDTAFPRGFAASISNQAADIGARRRARRYSKSLPRAF